MAHPAYGTMPHIPQGAGTGGFIPPPPGVSQGGEPNPYSHPSPYNWSNNAVPLQPQQYSSYPHASALGSGSTRSARSHSTGMSHRPAVQIPQQIQSQASYPYQFQRQPQAYLAQQPGQAWNLGRYSSSFPAASPFPIASHTPNGFNPYSPYPGSFQQAYSGQSLDRQLPSEEEPQVPFIPPEPEVYTPLPFGGTANAPRPLKPALKRSNSHSATNQPSGSQIHNINRRRSSSGGPELSDRNQENQTRLKKVVRSDSRTPEILGDQHDAQARLDTTIRPRSGSGEMMNQDHDGGNQERLNIVTRSRSGSGGPEMRGRTSENQARSKKKTTRADKPGPSRVIPVTPPAEAVTTSTAPNVSPTSPTSSASPTSPSSIPVYAQEDDDLYDGNKLSGRPRDWRPDYCPKLGTSLYLKLSRARSEGDAYEDSVKRSLHSLLEYTPHSPPLALDLRYKVKGRSGAILSQRVIRKFNSGDNVDFGQPALSPHASRIRLYHPKLPWYVDIHQSNALGVTLEDVLVQLSSQMRTPIRNRHYYNDSLNDKARAALGQRYSERTEGRENMGLKGVTQVDFLGEKFVMEGLVRGDKGLWEIKTGKR
ncbi:hypothetical protein Agabi119p4_11362 [Agaricus bisporus var. burnettii]|uniref:DUF6699 domain-containing protein n=1 Tax=Agaricus bisporus var. burnettii TaxID=192524 RepID=A0A8H7BX82_AGABI|nr:hypothetical protein Agabi119p4_11362 [Agaricus bisporus var. burnettii]